MDVQNWKPLARLGLIGWRQIDANGLSRFQVPGMNGARWQKLAVNHIDFAQTIWPFSHRQLLRGDFRRCDNSIFHGRLRPMVSLFIAAFAAALTVTPPAPATNVAPATGVS